MIGNLLPHQGTRIEEGISDSTEHPDVNNLNADFTQNPITKTSVNFQDPNLVLIAPGIGLPLLSLIPDIPDVTRLPLAMAGVLFLLMAAYVHFARK